MITLIYRGLAVIACVLLFPFDVAFALEPGEGIVLDPVTGNYMLTYSEVLENGNKVLTHGVFFPATKIAPAINSKFRFDRTGAVIYSYSVSSGAQSRQLLHTVRFDLFDRIVGSQDLPTNMQTTTEQQVAAVFEANKLALTTPSAWEGFISTNQSGASRITWNPINSGAGIRPGESQPGFGFVSQSLPGLDAAQLKGIRDGRNGFSGEGPDPSSDISKQIQALYQNDFIIRPAAVPTIAVPTPFDPAITLERIQIHTHTWIAKQLLDPAFSAQLDRYFQSAISAYRLNQPKAGKKHIQTMRELIKKEHADADREDDSGEMEYDGDKTKRPLIDKLAARILDFDLKYVTKRMGGDKDD